MKKHCLKTGYYSGRKYIKGILPLYDLGNEFIGWRKGYLGLCELDGTVSPLCRMPMSLKHRCLCKFRITERIFRLFPRIMVRINDSAFLVSFHGAIYAFDIKKKTVSCEHCFRRGMNNPLNMLVINRECDFSKGVYYGDYIGKKENSRIGIWYRGLSNKADWKCVFRFDPNEIKHIHGLIYDSYRNGLLILTGDGDLESGIWLAKKNFKEVTRLLVGKQKYRACIADPQEEGIVYATDAPTENNYLYFYNDKNLSLEKICSLPGTVIYGIKNSDSVFYSTTVEPDSNITGLRYRFSKKLGKGCKDKYIRLYRYNKRGNQLLLKLRKDSLPYTLCQFGTIRFASKGPDADRILAYSIAARSFDDTTFIVNDK